MNKISTAFNYAPVTLMGSIVALHNIAYGIMFAIDSFDFRRGLLHREIQQIAPAEFFGVIMIVTGILVMVGLLKQNDKLVSMGSEMQAVTWIFFGLIYVLAGLWVLSFAVAFTWVALNFAVKYCYLHRDLWWSGAGGPLDKRNNRR